MNLRWLWLDHVPPNIELTAEQQQEVRRIARRYRYAKGNLWRGDREFGKRFIPFAIAMYLGLFTIGVMPNATLMLTILCLVGSVGPAIGIYLYHLTYREHVYRALRDIGFEACVRCGYLLRGLSGDITKCPECGAEREKMPEGDSTTA